MSSVNFESDVFSYDPEELADWELPHKLAEKLPQKLLDAIAYWQCAAAAVGSGLTRIGKLDKESLHRGWQTRSGFFDLTPSSVTRTTTVIGTDTPPESPRVAISSSTSKMSYNVQIQAGSVHSAAPYVYSPPFTPLSTHSPSTPIRSRDSVNPCIDQIEKLSRSRQDSVIRGGSQFHEEAWEIFVDLFKFEIQMIREIAWPRLRDCSRYVESLEMQRELKGAVKGHFKQWWHTCQDKCRDTMLEITTLEVPNLELIKLERMAKGLSI